jgi:hypothetical protein
VAMAASKLSQLPKKEVIAIVHFAPCHNLKRRKLRQRRRTRCDGAMAVALVFGSGATFGACVVSLFADELDYKLCFLFCLILIRNHTNFRPFICLISQYLASKFGLILFKNLVSFFH